MNKVDTKITQKMIEIQTVQQQLIKPLLADLHVFTPSMSPVILLMGKAGWYFHEVVHKLAFYGKYFKDNSTLEEALQKGHELWDYDGKRSRKAVSLELVSQIFTILSIAFELLDEELKKIETPEEGTSK